MAELDLLIQGDFLAISWRNASATPGRSTSPTEESGLSRLQLVATINRVRFEWNEDKRRANFRTHGVDFLDAEAVFTGQTTTFEDTRQNYGERRFVTFGLLQGRVVALVHTEREDAIRIISMRKASKHEERSYFSQVPD